MKNSFSSLLPSFERERLSTNATTETSFAKYFEQSSVPCSFDPNRTAERINLGGYRMLVKKGTKRTTLLKFLLAKLWYNDTGISLEEFLLIFHLFYDLAEITEENFLIKNKNFLEVSAKILESISQNRAFPLVNKGYKEAIAPKGLPSKREYYGLCGQRDLKQSYKLILNDTLLPCKLAPQRYIGVGYKDKGTRRNLATDGNQSWQEVGIVFSNLEREAEEAELDIPISELPSEHCDSSS